MPHAELTDRFGRKLSYVRISVTDRCNFRCLYCMPPEGVASVPHSEILRYEDLEFLCSVLAGLGVKKFRFTGGEPLVRKGLVPFLQRLRERLPEAELALTTNGALLPEHAAGLARAGLASLNVSLDTLDAEKFRRITRTGGIAQVLDGIRAAKAAGINKIKLNTVLIKDFNDGEIAEIIAFARREGLTPRLIEFMPLDSRLWKAGGYVSAAEVLSRTGSGRWRETGQRKAQDGPARYCEDEESGDRIGVITAVSGHFCASCNRLRVSAAGGMRTCLFAPREIPLRDAVRSRDAEALAEAVIKAAAEKPERGSEVSTGELHMSGIGG